MGNIHRNSCFFSTRMGHHTAEELQVRLSLTYRLVSDPSYTVTQGEIALNVRRFRVKSPAMLESHAEFG